MLAAPVGILPIDRSTVRGMFQRLIDTKLIRLVHAAPDLTANLRSDGLAGSAAGGDAAPVWVRPGSSRLGNQAPLPNIFPGYDAPVVRPMPESERELAVLHWGFLLPQTSKKTSQPIQPKAVRNARDDKLLISPFWGDSIRQRRCLMPATSFSEPRGKEPATYHWFGLNGEECRPPFVDYGSFRKESVPRHKPLTNVSVGEILGEAIGLDPTKWGRAEQMRVSNYLKNNGWERYRKRDKEGREWRYRKDPKKCRYERD